VNFTAQILIPAEKELIQQLKPGSPFKRKAEEDLFNRFLYFIREGMSKYSMDEVDAFDAYSDTILHSVNNIVKGDFDERASLKTYLFRIFNNKCVDLIRKKTTNKYSIYQTDSITDALLMISDPAKTVIQQLVDKTDTDILKMKLEELGDNCKRILSLFADGCNDKEIATAMEYKTVDVVKTSRMRCLDKLRHLYTNKKDGNG
jgi:RNA polymerase sigma-70 factor (ECF subfamily)